MTKIAYYKTASHTRAALRTHYASERVTQWPCLARVGKTDAEYPYPDPSRSYRSPLRIPLQGDHIYVQLVLLKVLHHAIQACPRPRFIAERVQRVQPLLPRQFDDEEIAFIRAQHRRVLDSVVLRRIPKFGLSNLAQPTLQCAQLEDSKAIATDSDGSGQFPPTFALLHCIRT